MNERTKKTLIIAALLLVVVAIGIVKSIKNSADYQMLESDDTQSTAPLPRLLELGSRKCIPCKMMVPILKELKTEYAGKLEVKFIDVWQDRTVGQKYSVRVIPTQIFFDAQGNELFRHEGFFAKEDILAKFKELGVQLEKDQ